MSEIKELCYILNKRGILLGKDNKDKITRDADVIQSLEYLPSENMKSLLTFDYSQLRGKTFREVKRLWNQAGLLDFMPYVNDDSYIPALTVRHDRHICIYSNKFVAVDSLTRKNVKAESISNISYLLSRSETLDDFMNNSRLVALLLYASFMDVGFRYDSFRDWLSSKPDLVDVFMKDAAHYFGRDLSNGLMDIAGLIKFDNQSISEYRNIYSLSIDGREVCRFAYGRKTVEVKIFIKSKTNHVVVKIPKEDTSNLSPKDESTVVSALYGRVNSKCKVYNTQLILLAMAMKICGIHVDLFTACRLAPNASNGPVSNEYKVVRSFMDLKGTLPDEY